MDGVYEQAQQSSIFFIHQNALKVKIKDALIYNKVLGLDKQWIIKVILHLFKCDQDTKIVKRKIYKVKLHRVVSVLTFF